MGIVHRREIAAADDPEREHDRLAAEYEAEHVSAAVAAREGFVDELVSPRETRRRISGALTALSGPGCVRATGRGTSRCDVRGPRRQLHRRRRAGGPAGQTSWPSSSAARYVNLAAVGATSEQVEREQLERALELQPDVVTIVCGANDVLFSTRPDPEAYAARLDADVRAAEA